ncbi:MAG: hypothetical protein HON98_04605 [Chloroflexi bacterium]|jgi:hypothetical protein|nr:hypothetical protein [Chloroflexota bacterium]MBT3671181.1 hypothetical protein [Chloroflexota bacterium]MBT4002537.1 hypothetical protein [Chloroflexota bacterium]MBT4304360.1 hypothetical protein [Chloroflexota bacterium]MBT4534379.1 hypothetical protein [Chloroflexota bacterium]
MDQFDFIEEEKKKPKRRKNFSGFIWSMGALYFMCMAVFLVGYFAMIYIDPQSPYNLFPAPTSTPTAPPNPMDILNPTLTYTPPPTVTPMVVFPTATARATDVGPTVEPTELVVEGTFFDVQEGSPVWAEHFSGVCDSMYVGGVVLDIDGAPMMDVLIQLGGTVGDQPLYEELVFPGQAPQFGESGFEFDLGEPQETPGTAYLIVLDEDGNIISGYLFFPTMEDCSQNLTIFNIVQTN